MWVRVSWSPPHSNFLHYETLFVRPVSQTHRCIGFVGEGILFSIPASVSYFLLFVEIKQSKILFECEKSGGKFCCVGRWKSLGGKSTFLACCNPLHIVIQICKIFSLLRARFPRFTAKPGKINLIKITTQNPAYLSSNCSDGYSVRFGILAHLKAFPMIKLSIRPKIASK